MDDNSKKVRRCGQIGEGANDLVLFQDVLEEQKRLQEDASAVLGASDPKHCTYPKGYLKRQALYACATCTPNGNAGICLACSYACHEGHDLYELYTKRNFCCDCGNDKFPDNKCKLVKDKILSSRNRYNHNFKGLYCSCSRPYPDHEDNLEDEMIQCIICEDWLHGRHLNTSAPEEFCEMICPECMTKFPFLWAYKMFSVCDEKQEDIGDTNHQVDVVNTEPLQEITNGEIKEATKSNVVTNELHDSTVSTSNTESCKQVKLKRERDTADIDEHDKIKRLKTEEPEKLDNDSKGNHKKECLLKKLKNDGDFDILEHAVFWPPGWRLKLCKCSDCMDMYKDKDIEFLIDESDTVLAYEEAGNVICDEDITEKEEENIFEGFEGMHRVQQIEIARGVSDLRNGLSEFLQGFAREGKVVTETDIREFFQSLEEKRKRRMNLPQNNCH